MAITIVKNFTQNKFYPSQNPINCTVSSNNSGKCNFRFICDIYINGTKVFTDKLFPDPNTGYGFFQLSRVLQDYIQTSIPKSQYGQVLNAAATLNPPSANLTVYCRFGEEYDSSTECDGSILQYSGLAQSNTFYVFETAIDYEDWPSFNSANLLVGTNSNTTQFLTNSPRSVDVSFNDSYYLDFISLQSITTQYAVNVKVYYKDGSFTTSTYTRNLSGSLVERYRIACGPLDLNLKDNGVTIGGDVVKYEVWLKWSSNQVSEVFTFNVKAPKAFRTRIGFVGLKGGLEHFTFYHRNRKTFNIDRRNYEKFLQSNYSGDWTYQVGDRGTTTYKVSAKEVHTVASYCEKETALWLNEMWLSPIVWTYRGPDTYTFRPFIDGLYVKFWVDGDHGIEAGDTIFCFSETPDFDDKFVVNSVSDNIVDCNLLASVYGVNVDGACGIVHVAESWQMLPIVISDNSSEVKQKTSRPVEYQLNYQMAYQKNTLRG